MSVKIKFCMSNKISVNLRRNTIYTRLKNGEVLDSYSLADQFNVSWRTIHRDFTEYFSSIEEGLVQNPDTHKWYISKEYKNSFLTQNEQIAIELLLDLSKQHSGEFYLQTKKLIDKFTNSVNDSIFYSKINTESFDEIKDMMIKVEKAIHQKQIITCRYNNKDRRLAPLKIASFDGYWYLVVKDLNKDTKNINTYYFKDIEDLEVTQETHDSSCPQLQKKLDNAINAYFVADTDIYPVVLHATKEVVSDELLK